MRLFGRRAAARDSGQPIANGHQREAQQVETLPLRRIADARIVGGHAMKTAVQLRGDLDGAELKAAARELETMLVGYLVARLAPAGDR